jgi:class 3 adenylate cyclase/tetratricopeptide (TPR) repeat protein
MREERRIVTALFADMCGSTALTERLDPEDAREILGSAVAQVIEQVDALGGTVKDLAGDGVLALFGAPTAHEDDVERAVLCGLRIVSAVADTSAQVARDWHVDGFGVRVGIETGRAVLGRVGGGSRIEYGATGDVVNTAARLQAVADLGTVLVGAESRAVVEGRFTWQPAQEHWLKGKQQPVTASAVVSYSPRPAVLRGDVGLVGRDDEVQVVADRVGALRAGRGSVLVLVGDAGVGKSRLVAEVRARLRGAATWLEAGGTSFAASVPYGVYRSALLGWLRVPAEAAPDDVAAAVNSRAEQEPPQVAEPLRALLPLLTGRLADREHSADEQGRVFASVRNLVDSMTSGAPVLLVLEDLHWSDPTSLGVSEALLPLALRRPLMVVATLRPDPAGSAALARLVAAVDGARVVELAPLTRSHAQELLHRRLGGDRVPRKLERRLLDSTQGNPFFLEEQLRVVESSGVLHAPAGIDRTDLADVVLAPTVERALVARIDQLAESSRRLLLTASVLGPRFDGSLLTAVSDTDPSTAALDALVDADLLVADPAFGHEAVTFRFRHALVLDAAYNSLLRKERRTLHARAAEALLQVYAGRERDVAARLGHHLAEAGDPARGVGHLAVAARDAARSYGHEEAAQLARRAVDLLCDGRSDLADDELRLAAEMLRVEGAAHRELARYPAAIATYRRLLGLLNADEAMEAVRVRSVIGQLLADEHRYDEALAELESAASVLGEGPRSRAEFEVWLAVLLATSSALYWLGDHERHLRVLRNAEAVVEEFASVGERLDFDDAVRSAWLRRDRYVVSDEMADLDRRIFDSRRRSPDEEVRGWASFMHGFTLLWRRDVDEARRHLADSLTAADHVGSALLRSRALTYLAVTARFVGDAETAADLLPRVREAAEEAGLAEYDGVADAIDAWLAWRAGDRSEAQRRASGALDTWRSLPMAFHVQWMAILPVLALAVDDGDRAASKRLVRELLAPSQHPLPTDIAEPLQRGRTAADEDRWPAADVELRTALDRASELGYL